MFRSTRRHFKPGPFWGDLIDRWKASGQSVAAFCAAHRLGQATFYSWRNRLATQTWCTTPPDPAFALVRVVPDPTAEVVLPNGLIVRVPAAVVTTHLGRDPLGGDLFVFRNSPWGSLEDPGLAVGAGLCRARPLPARHPMGEQAGDGCTARVVRTQGLP
jgi:hypothetical protein